MAYVEFLPLFDAAGAEEFDAVAYTDVAARERYAAELEKRAKQPVRRGESVLRFVDWSDRQVTRFNAVMHQHYDLVTMAAMEVDL